jgi:hypothetical protein
MNSAAKVEGFVVAVTDDLMKARSRVARLLRSRRIGKMAPGRPNAPPELAAALDTLDLLAAGHIARARVPTAA